MAYQNIHVDKQNNMVHLWDDQHGHTTFPYPRYAFKKKAGGRYRSIYGDELARVTNFNENDPELFESDLPPETRILIDAYEDSDEPSVGHNVVFIDIEVDSEGGFPNIKEGDKEITAISLYDSTTKKYHAYILDKNHLVQGKTLGVDVELHDFDDEETLLMAFLNKWEELGPTIVTGWNCVDENSYVSTNKHLKKIKDICINDTMKNYGLVLNMGRSHKKSATITLADGRKINTSHDHRFPVCFKRTEEYKYFNTLSDSRLDASVTIISNEMNHGNNAYLFVPKQENTNTDCEIDGFTLQLLGMIYTDGNRSKTDNCICITGINYDSLSYYASNITHHKYSEKEITPKPIRKRKPHHSQEYRIRFYGNDTFRNNLRLIYNKTVKSLDVEELSKLSTEDFSCFISGMIDGDGHVRRGILLCQKPLESKEKLQLLLSWNGVYSTIQKSGVYIPFSESNKPFIDLLKSKVTHTKRYKKLLDSATHKEKNTPRKLLKSFHGDKYSLIRIEKIEDNEKRIGMVDIKTEGSYFIANSITTHNCDFFDMPYLYTRTKAVCGQHNAKRLSPIGSCYMRKGLDKMVIAGVSVLDYLLLYKKFSRRNMPNHQLNTVGKIVVKMEKIHFDGNLTDLYNNDVKKYIEYNLQDVRIVVALDEKLKFIDLAKRICHTGHVPYEWFHMSSRYLDGAIILYIRRNGGLIAPNKPVGGREQYAEQETGDEDEEEGFEGAYVKPPVPGRYDWVYDLDLTSMYPKIIISLNISPETKAAKCFKVAYTQAGAERKRKEIIKENADSDKPISDMDKLEELVARKLKEFDMDYHVRGDIESYDLGQAEYTKDELDHLIKTSNYSLSSNGILYTQDQRGIIPEILTKWFAERVEMRKLAKECLKTGDKVGYEFNNVRQEVQKILLNSCYGVLGLPVFRFYDIDNAEAVTKTGVTIIKTTAKAINLYYKKVMGIEGDWVVYSDTDSCFVDAAPMIRHKFPDIDTKDEKAMTDAIMKVTDEVQLYVNSFYDTMAEKLFHLTKSQFQLKRGNQLISTTHEFEAKQEVIAKTGIWLAKKRYALWVIHKEGVLLPSPELDVKGIDIVRTSFPAKFREFMKSFLINILDKVDREVIDERVLKFAQDVPTLDIMDIAKNTSIKFVSRKGDIHYYPKDRQPFSIVCGTPAQVKAGINYNDLLKKWGLNKKTEPVLHGQKIKWVYLRENEFGLECMALKADGNDPKQMLDFINTNVDRQTMYEKELKGKLENFYEVMKWEFPSEEKKTAAQFFDF